ncbi:VOC family protein [Celeribacter arenosi]|uniref:Catechol 2,3-dioxygenase n=1 Tax=Celeribacter arenosi TaxID=792649 RepID=A0ABP7JV06_9RHOB
MLTDAQNLAKRLRGAGLPERFSWRHFDLQVTDLKAATHFWTVAFGLRIRNETETSVALGTNKRDLVILHAGAQQKAEPGYMGMYHLAIGVPELAELARLYARFVALGLRVSPVDHLTSKSLYLADPDGLEVEFALETPERLKTYHEVRNGCVMTDVNGNLHSGRERLNVQKELTPAKDADLRAHISEDTFLSHLHLRVPKLEAAADWYQDLGFAKNIVLPQMGMIDLGAGDPYGHRIALNNWLGPDIQRPPSNMARLIGYELDVQDKDTFANAKGLTPSGTELSGLDVAGLEAKLWPKFEV